MSGTNSELEMITGGPVVVLVEPQLGENIGMVARAMANFGLSELRLVAPRDGWPSDKARAAASKADHVIDGAIVYDTLQEALADLNFVYATTARMRDGFKPVRSPIVASKTLKARYDAGEKVGILFGREKSGLSNEQVALADEIVTFPVNPAFASLNIAQAVLLMSYEWMKQSMASEDETLFSATGQTPATKEQLFGFFSHIEDALDARGFFRPADKKPKMIDNLRAVWSRRALTFEEIKLLRGVISSLDRFSRKNPRGAGNPEDFDD